MLDHPPTAARLTRRGFVDGRHEPPLGDQAVNGDVDDDVSVVVEVAPLPVWERVHHLAFDRQRLAPPRPAHLVVEVR